MRMFKTVLIILMVALLSFGSAAAQVDEGPDNQGPPEQAGPDNGRQEQNDDNGQGPPEHVRDGEIGPPEHANAPDEVRERIEERLSANDDRRGPPAHAGIPNFVREMIFGEDIEDEEDETYSVTLEDPITEDQDSIEVEATFEGFESDGLLSIENKTVSESVYEEVYGEETFDVYVDDIGGISVDDEIEASLFEDEEADEALVSDRTTVISEASELEITETNLVEVLTDEEVEHDYEEAIYVGVEETADVDPGEVTVSLTIEGDETEEKVFEESESTDELEAGEEIYQTFVVGEIETPDRYEANMTVETDYAETITESHEFEVQEKEDENDDDEEDEDEDNGADEEDEE